MTSPTFKDVMDKILTEVQCMTAQNQKLGQKEALSAIHPHYQTCHFRGHFKDLVAKDF